MSARNGDKSRFGRERKAKIRKRAATKLLRKQFTAKPDITPTPAP